MGLQTSGFGLEEVLADALDVGGVEGVGGEGVLGDEFDQTFADALVDDAIEARFHLGVVAIADGLDEQLAKGAAGQGGAEDVEDLPAQVAALLLQLFKEASVDLALAGAVGHEVPEVADLGLTDAVHAPEALLNSVGVPRQVVVDDQVGSLEVDALPG